MNQPSLFPGMDADGLIATSGARIVYVFHSFRLQAFKVGFTAHSIEARARAGRTWIPDLKFYGSFVVCDDQDDHFVHDMLAVYRIKGELFRDTPEVRRVLDKFIESQRDRRDPPAVVWMTPRQLDGVSKWAIYWACLGCNRTFFDVMVFMPAFAGCSGQVRCPNCGRGRRINVELDTSQ